MLAARGGLLLFADADGATPIREEERLRQAIGQGADLAAGCRFGTDSISERNWFRNLSGRMFAQVVKHLFPLPIPDTQCGFKMFRGHVGRRLAAMCCERGYLFDVEILALACQLGYKSSAVSVAWHEVPGSKVHMLSDGWSMLTGLRRIRHQLRKAAKMSL